MDAVFVLYEQITALDLIGPYEVLASHPDVTVHFAAESAEPVRCDKGLSVTADMAFGDVSGPDLIVVPGSLRWRSALSDGDIITCAGVSAGIDMGLTLAATLWGEPAARAIQLGLEYDPQPPFDSGSLERAAPELVSAVRAAIDRA